MATINNVEFYRGEAVRLSFTMSPVTDITGWTMVLTLRNNANDTAALATVTVVIISAVAGTFRADLTHAQTTLTPGNYAYDVQRTDAGSEAVLSVGVLMVKQEVLY